MFEAGTGTGDWFPSTAISGDGRSLATLQDRGAVSLVDLATLRRRSLPIRGAPAVPPAAAATPAFGPRGKLAVVSGVDGFLALVDARTGRVLARLRGHRDVVFTPTASADGGIIASTGPDGTLRLWGRAPCPSGLGRRSASAGRRPATRVSPRTARRSPSQWPPARSTSSTCAPAARLARLRVDVGNPTFSGYSRDGRLLLAGSKDGRVRVFTARDLRPLGPAFPADNGSVSSVDASPDDRTLVTAGSDGQTRLWDVATRQPIGTPLPGPRTSTPSRRAPDGKHVFAVFRDGRGYRWDVRSTSWERQACKIAGRRLTRAEWDAALADRTYAPAC